MLPVVLLAMQASGMIIDYMGKKQQIELSRMGNKIEQAGINRDIQMSRLEAEEGSLEAMRNLRKNLGTQAAMLAARGTRSGAGTAALFGNQSVANFNANEKMRELNQLGKEANLRAGGLLSNLHQQTSEKKIWGEFKKSVFDKIPTDPAAYKNFGSKGGFGFKDVGA